MDAARKMAVQAARPTLFSATARPELIMAVLYANLMSDRLWDLAANVAKPPGRPVSEEDFLQRMTRLHKLVNGRFYHAAPLEFARVWGLHERETIQDPDDLDANDYAMEILARGFERRKEMVSWAPMLLQFLKMGAFPEYVYPTVDAILAHGPLLRSHARRPLGMTSCADECILIAALALATRTCGLDDILFLGSPFHYSLFLFPEGSQGFWFNAKRELFDAQGWAMLCSNGPVTSCREAFESRMLIFDRVITPRGYCIFPKGRTSLSPQRLQHLLERAGRFIGIDLSPLSPGIGQCLEIQGRSEDEKLSGLVDRCGSGEEVRACLKDLAARESDPIALAALYAFRSLEVPDPGAYVAAALAGFKTYIRAAEISSMDEALALVRKIPGVESVLKRPDRLALPDEVLIFQTANERERALLLYTLLVHSPFLAKSEKDGIEISIGREPWSVRYGGKEFAGLS